MRSASDNTEISLAMRQLARAGFGFATGSEKLTNLKFSSALASPFLDFSSRGDLVVRFGVDFSGNNHDLRVSASTCIAAGSQIVSSRELGLFALWDDRAADLTRVLGAKPVRIPQADCEEFLLQDFPRLNDIFAVDSLDGTFTCPKYRYRLQVSTVPEDEQYRIHLRPVREWAGHFRETTAPPEQITQLSERVSNWLRTQASMATFDSYLSYPASRINQLLNELEKAFSGESLYIDRRGIPRSFSQSGGQIELDLIPNEYGWFTPKVRLHFAGLEGLENAEDVERLEELEDLEGRDYDVTDLSQIRERGGLIKKDTYLTESEMDFLTLLNNRTRLNQRGIHPAIIQLSQILEGTEVKINGLDAWNSLKIDLPEIASPQGVKLREYQQAGVSWLLAQLAIGPGALLADEMGLGKTLQILAAIKSLPVCDQVLIVAPTSVINVWESQAQQFYPDISVLSLRSGTEIEEGFAGADLVITSYGLLRRHADSFISNRWQGLILDEAQQVKNPRTQAWRVLADMPRDWTICATGTPLENSLADLHAILSLAQPGTLLSREQFAGLELSGGEQARSLVAPYMLRRTKEQVAPDLPPKIEQVLRVDLEPNHALAYRELEAQARRQVGKILGEGNRMSILAALTALRRASLDLRLVGARAKTFSAKTRTLIEQLQTIPDHKALVFSQFTSYLGLIREALETAGIKTCYLDGSTRRRDQVVKEFSEGEAQVFLISLRAGGTGLTLTAADYVFVMDPWWNPAVEEQAIDRAHRIGQERPVNVYRLVSAGTIEEKVSQLQQRKRDLFSSVVNASSSITDLADALLMNSEQLNRN